MSEAPEYLMKVQIIGTVRGEVSVNTTGTGKKVANFTVFCGQAGQRKVTVWEEMAERAFAEVRDGARVFVEGRVARRNFKKNGPTGEETVWYDQITASELRVLDAPEAPTF